RVQSSEAREAAEEEPAAAAGAGQEGVAEAVEGLLRAGSFAAGSAGGSVEGLAPESLPPVSGFAARVSDRDHGQCPAVLEEHHVEREAVGESLLDLVVPG